MKESYGVCERFDKILEGKVNKEFANKRLKQLTVIYEPYDGYKGDETSKIEIQEYNAEGQLVMESMFDAERLFYEVHLEYENGKIVKSTNFMLNAKQEKVAVEVLDIKYSIDGSTVLITRDYKKKGEIQDFIMSITKDLITVSTVEDGESKIICQQYLDENGEVIKYVDTQYSKEILIEDVE